MSLRSSRWWSGLKLVACAGALSVFAACGGDVFQPFRPDRVISFGDEYSYISPTGQKYSINYLDANGPNCDNYRIWNQIVVEEEYGFSFAQCNRGGRTGNRVAQLYAQPGATVAGLAQQIDSFLAGNTLGEHDLILMQVGGNDVWEIFNANGGQATDAAKADARARGAALGAQIARVVALGARVLSIDVIFQGSTPKGRAAGEGPLNELTDSFNSGFYFSFPANSRTATYAQINSLVRRINDINDASRPFKFSNVFDPACTNTTPTNTAIDCTNATLRPDVNPADNSFSFEFADDRFITPAVSRLMGNLARDRAHNHPF